MEFTMQSSENTDAKHVTFYDNEIKVINWDKQVFKLQNYGKVKEIDDCLKFSPAVKSFVAIKANGKLLYNVSIIAIASSTSFCSRCPKIFVNRGNTILNMDSTINIYVQDIPSVDEKYKTIKDNYGLKLK